MIFIHSDRDKALYDANLLLYSQFVYNLMACGKKSGNAPTEDFILGSPAPVDVAAKISAIFRELSFKVSLPHLSTFQNQQKFKLIFLQFLAYSKILSLMYPNVSVNSVCIFIV